MLCSIEPSTNWRTTLALVFDFLYHLVFTLPHELNPLILGNRTALFKLFV